MSQNDTAQWVRSIKLATVAGPIALCFFGGAFFFNDSLRLFGWGLAAGLTITATGAIVDGYMRRGPLDTSRAATDAKARRVRALTIGCIAVGFVASIILHPGGSSALGLGCVIGIFAFAALLFSPLFAPEIAARSPASPLSRMTSMERAARKNYDHE
jgi:hypothetical protein